jgi:hypothetical protein
MLEQFNLTYRWQIPLYPVFTNIRYLLQNHDHSTGAMGKSALISNNAMMAYSKTVLPKIMLIENVPAHVNLGKRAKFILTKAMFCA